MRLRKSRLAKALGVTEPMDRAARRRAHRAERASEVILSPRTVAPKGAFSVAKRRQVVVPKPGRMTAEQRRARNARRLNARQLVGVVSHLKHIGMTEPEIREFLRTGGRAA